MSPTSGSYNPPSDLTLTFNKPMGVATYKTSKDMSDELKKALPDIEDLKKLLEAE